MAQITLIGVGMPAPTPLRYGSSYVLQIGDDCIMFDCGPATTYKMVRAGLSPVQVEHLFFTHHHFDHDADYGCFTMTRWDLGAGKIPPLQVLGPTLTVKITGLLFGEKEGVFSFDVRARINHPLSLAAWTGRGGALPRTPPQVSARDIGPGEVLSGKTWRVTAAPAEHVQPYLDSLAYRVDSEEGSVVVSGDTRPCESVTKLAEGADVLLHMCTGFQDRMDGTPSGDAMTGTKGAARVARDAGVRKLVLVHCGDGFTPPGQLEEAVAEVKGIYAGPVVLGHELMTISIP